MRSIALLNRIICAYEIDLDAEHKIVGSYCGSIMVAVLLYCCKRTGFGLKCYN